MLVNISGNTLITHVSVKLTLSSALYFKMYLPYSKNVLYLITTVDPDAFSSLACTLCSLSSLGQMIYEPREACIIISQYITWYITQNDAVRSCLLTQRSSQGQWIMFFIKGHWRSNNVHFIYDFNCSSMYKSVVGTIRPAQFA